MDPVCRSRKLAANPIYCGTIESWRMSQMSRSVPSLVLSGPGLFVCFAFPDILICSAIFVWGDGRSFDNNITLEHFHRDFLQ